MTEAVVAAQKLRESEARLQLATAVAQLGVFVWDTVEDLGSWENDRVYEIFRRARQDGPVNGEEFLRDFLHPDFRDAFRDAVERTLKKGAPLQFEGLMYRADRTLCRIELNGNLQPDVKGSKGRILGTIRDVTELRKSQETLRENAKRLGELAAIVASSEDVIRARISTESSPVGTMLRQQCSAIPQMR